jgi:hypothetical protein
MDTLSEIMAAVVAAKARMDALAAGDERGLVFPCRHGGKVVVSRDASKPGSWRATRLDESGEPTGHTEAQTFRDAIRAAYDRGAVL